MLFTGSKAFAGSTELSKVQRDKRKLGAMSHALIAEHMFTPNLDTYTGDDAIIDTHVHPRRFGPRYAGTCFNG